MGNCLNTLRRRRREQNDEEYRVDSNVSIWTTFLAPPPSTRRTYMQKMNGFIDRKSQREAQAGHIKLLETISIQRPNEVLPPVRQVITSRIRRRDPETNMVVYMTMITRLETQIVVNGKEVSRPKPRFIVTGVRPMSPAA